MHAVIFRSSACIVLSEILPKNVIGFPIPILDNWNVLYLIAMSSRKKNTEGHDGETDRDRQREIKHLIGFSFSAGGHNLHSLFSTSLSSYMQFENSSSNAYS